MYRAWNRPHWYEGRCVVLSIESGEISWEVINTRNIDNIALEIDHSDEAVSHNDYVCNLLSNRESYYDYLSPILKRQVKFDMQRLELKFQPKTIKRSFKVFVKCIIRYIKGTKTDNDEILLNVFRNDLKRARMLRMLIGKN